MGLGYSIHFELAENKAAVVSYFYGDEDESFFRDIHKRAGTKEECIKDTIETISEKSKMFLVYARHDLAAFFVKYENKDRLALEGFHVTKKYRSKAFLKQFWILVRSVMGNEYYTGIYVKNQPAIRCLHKAGLKPDKLMEVDKQMFIIFKSE